MSHQIYIDLLSLISGLLLVPGLVLNIFGALFLIGPNQSINRFSIRAHIIAGIWPELERSDSGYRYLKKNRKLTPSQKGFYPLADIYQNHIEENVGKVPISENKPKRFELYKNDGEYNLRFVFNNGHHLGRDISNLKDILDRRIRYRYIQTGVILLVCGFILQILSEIF